MSHLLDCTATFVPSSAGISRGKRSHWTHGTPWCQYLWASGKGPLCAPCWGCCWDQERCFWEEGTGLTLPTQQQGAWEQRGSAQPSPASEKEDHTVWGRHLNNGNTDHPRFGSSDCAEALCYALDKQRFTQPSPQLRKGAAVTVPISQTRKLKARE